MTIEAKIIAWSKERGIFKDSTPLKQAKKAKEEVYELIDELFSVLDGLSPEEEKKAHERALMEAGDVLFCMVNVCHMLGGYTIQDCLWLAYDKNKDRVWEMKEGYLVKEK